MFLLTLSSLCLYVSFPSLKDAYPLDIGPPLLLFGAIPVYYVTPTRTLFSKQGQMLQTLINTEHLEIPQDAILVHGEEVRYPRETVVHLGCGWAALATGGFPISSVQGFEPTAAGLLL